MLIAAILILLGTAIILHGATPAASSREILVIAETPTLTEFAADSAALRYYAGQGVSGVLVHASTLESLTNGRDVALAGGNEVLRLFRMEGMVNIWMWEQIRDRAVRADASYVMTNQLVLFESILAALTHELGEGVVRPYRDGEHDFGGDIPGNYIIEVLAPVDVVRGVAVGVSKTVREQLRSGGLDAIVEVATAADVSALPEPVPTVFVTSSAAADALYAQRRPNRIFLTRGVSNPGWGQALLAERPGNETFAVSGDAVIVAPTDAGREIALLKQQGFTVKTQSVTTPHEEANSGSSALTFWGHSLLALALMTFVFQILVGLFSARVSPLTQTGMPTTFLTATASGGSAAIVLIAWATAPSFFPEIAGGFLAILTVLHRLRFKESGESRQRRLITALAITAAVAATLLAGQLVAVNRPVPAPWTIALLTIAAAATSASRSSDKRTEIGWLVAAMAVAASAVIPDSPALLAGLMAATLIASPLITKSEALEAVRLLAWPAALAVLLNPGVTFPWRGALAALAVATLAGSLYLPARGQTASLPD